MLGFNSQAIVVYNRNREGSQAPHRRENGVIARPSLLGSQSPRNYDVVYAGYNGDGHVGDVNLTSALYYAAGKESAGSFVPTSTRISALFAAVEASMDFDWIRARISGLYGSGDDNPFDRTATGFDAIVENPQFAGGDSTYWNRQSVTLVSGGGVVLSGRNGLLNSLRSSKDAGQSTFTNPGILLAGIGTDMDLLPTLRASLNANDLFFADTAVLEVVRNQGSIHRHIGYDLSASVIWRPLFSQNIVLRASGATLVPGRGFADLFPDRHPYSVQLNAILTY